VVGEAVLIAIADVESQVDGEAGPPCDRMGRGRPG